MDFWNFIDTNKHVDTLKLRLNANKAIYGFDLNLAITQIECRKKYAYKLSNFISNPRFLFPDEISGQQASHQAVAKFHASLLNNEKNILDMTAGLGIDSFEFASINNVHVTSVELDSNKASALVNNSKILGKENLNVVNEEAIDFLKSSKLYYDLIFVDPSRRGSQNQRFYNLRDCSPDIILNQELIFQKAQRIFIKASPMLDISQTLKDFRHITSIRVIGVKGECKELLIEILRDVNHSEKVELGAIDLDYRGNVISQFYADNFCDNIIEYASLPNFKPGAFILEPSAMVMKISPWGKLCQVFNAKKLGKSSHLFISDEYPQDFPGRVSRYIAPLTKKDRKSLIGFPATVVSKNYPIPAEKLRKNFQIKEGDSSFIYATRIGDSPFIFKSESIT